MNIILYKNESDPIVVDKNLTTMKTVQGNLKEDASFLNPVILLNLNTPPTANYAFIPDFGRYYYITDYTYRGRFLWEITLRVDVLMSWKNGIKSNTAILKRQEHLFNLDLTDDLLGTTNETFILTKSLDNSIGDFMDAGYVIVAQ